MTWTRRLRLSAVLLTVLAGCAALTLYVNHHNGLVEGSSATLAADDYPVGTNYSGTITAQYVQVGTEVKAGDPLFEVSSPILERDLAQGLVSGDAPGLQLKDDRTVVLTATHPGRVSSIAIADGAFVPSGATIATIQRAESMFVEAQFVLSPGDFSRIPAGAEVSVVLPDDQELTATVVELQVDTRDGQAWTTVRAQSPELASGAGIFAVGTPVGATLHLTNDGFVTDVSTEVSGWLGLDG